MGLLMSLLEFDLSDPESLVLPTVLARFGHSLNELEQSVDPLLTHTLPVREAARRVVDAWDAVLEILPELDR
jgi:hypothetical protein